MEQGKAFVGGTGQGKNDGEVYDMKFPVDRSGEGFYAKFADLSMVLSKIRGRWPTLRHAGRERYLDGAPPDLKRGRDAFD
jgi:hypothetical protein